MTKKISLSIILSVFLLLIDIYSVSCEERHKFGIGFLAGEPTSLNAKYWLDKDMAIDGGIGWAFGNFLHIYSDILWHNYDIIKVKKGRLPLHLGIGGRIKIHAEEKRDNAPSIAFRVPIGGEYFIPKTPLSVFIDLVPLFIVYSKTDVNFEGGLGLRFYF